MDIVLILIIVSLASFTIALGAWAGKKIGNNIPIKNTNRRVLDEEMLTKEDLVDEDFVEIPETFTTVDLGVTSGFKFGIGFALGCIVVTFMFFVFFGAVLAGMLQEFTRSSI